MRSKAADSTSVVFRTASHVTARSTWGAESPECRWTYPRTMRSKRYFEPLDQRLSAYTAEVPDGPWPPSQRAIDAGCRAFAGRATAGIAAGHDVLVTDWPVTGTETEGGWFSGDYDRYSPNGLPV